MPISDLLLVGVELMLLGMGIVFVFLVILVFALGLMSRISKMFYTEEPALPNTSNTTSSVPTKPDNTALIAVISAAIARYRSNH